MASLSVVESIESQIERMDKRKEVIPIEYKFCLRELRQANGMSQVELARLLGLRSPSTITMWENGQRHPPNMTLPKLADTLHCTIDELFGRDPPEQAS